MSMISEQVKQLRYVANGMEIGSYDERILIDMLNNAADTIESLFTRLQAESTEAATPYGGGWIPCSEQLPEERDSIFAKLKGTDKWKESMFEKTSKEVLVTVEDEKGDRATMTAHTIDGEWRIDSFLRLKVIAWQPLPEHMIT